MSDKDMKEAIENSAKKLRNSHTNFGRELTPDTNEVLKKNKRSDNNSKIQKEHVKNSDISKNVFY